MQQPNDRGEFVLKSRRRRNVPQAEPGVLERLQDPEGLIETKNDPGRNRTVVRA